MEILNAPLVNTTNDVLLRELVVPNQGQQMNQNQQEQQDNVQQDGAQQDDAMGEHGERRTSHQRVIHAVAPR